jgi:hypothetical protein
MKHLALQGCVRATELTFMVSLTQLKYLNKPPHCSIWG